MIAPRAFFFGCWNDSGHFLFHPGGVSVRGAEERAIARDMMGAHLDGNYAPRRACRGGATCWSGQGESIDARRRIEYASEELPQGQFLRHQREGFTLIAWWDRTQGDTRPGCNSTFLLEGDHTSAAMLAGLAQFFPHILQNLTTAGVELREVVP